MEFFAKRKRSPTPDPGPSKRRPAPASPETCVGCEIVYEGEMPLKADLVFVHGLGGHLYNTWSKNGVFWPKDLLGRDIQNVRIITFGYDSRVVKFFGQVSRNQIRDHAQTLISDLRRCRKKGEENTRPIIFVAHSLGGLVVKDALEFAKQTAEDQPRDGMIFLSTYGVVFLGTPHRGTHQAGWGTLTARVCRAILQDANTGILQSLEQDSGILERIGEAFERLMAREKVKAYSFVEGIPTLGVGMDLWQEQVVGKYSGHIGNVLEGKGYIHATHQDMSKFGNAQEMGYKSVVGVVGGFIVGAMEAVESKRLPRSVSATGAGGSTREPRFMVPFCRSSDFVGRGYILEKLEESFISRGDYQPRVALWGLGGVGKTQIAIEFCFWRKSQGRDVFWVHGSSEEAFGASFREIAQSVQLVRSGADQGALLKAVRSWFESQASGNWTIVIDNLDDIELESRLCIPAHRGEILFTTRDERILGHPGLVPAGAGIEVSTMSVEEAVETFCRIVGFECPAICSTSFQLLTLLDGLPLAIAQAATYIRTARMPMAGYLALFQRGKKNQQALLSEPLPSALRNAKTDFSRAVMTTLQLTVQKIEQESPLSIKTLQILSFLDPDILPSSLLKTTLRPKGENLFKHLAPLLNFGLLTHLGSSRYRLHRLVSMWTQVKMSPEVRHHCIDQAIGLMTTCLPRESHQNATKYFEMLPHAISILDHIGSDWSKFISAWKLQQNVSRFLREIGRLQLALDHALLSLRHEKAFEQDESKRYISRSSIGGVYSSMAEYTNALDEYQLALGGLERTLGKDHPRTLKTVQRMANVFCLQGEYDKALERHQWALDVWNKSGNPGTFKAFQHMALLFKKKGEYGKALEWYQRAFDDREKACGKDHPKTLRTVQNIAVLFKKEGEPDKALEWHQRALDGWEKAFGKDYPDTLRVVRNMARIFKEKGEYDKALKWYQRALDGQERTLGRGHPDTIRAAGIVATMSNLSNGTTSASPRRHRKTNSSS